MRYSHRVVKDPSWIALRFRRINGRISIMLSFKESASSTERTSPRINRNVRCELQGAMITRVSVILGYRRGIFASATRSISGNVAADTGGFPESRAIQSLPFLRVLRSDSLCLSLFFFLRPIRKGYRIRINAGTVTTVERLSRRALLTLGRDRETGYRKNARANFSDNAWRIAPPPCIVCAPPSRARLAIKFRAYANTVITYFRMQAREANRVICLARLPCRTRELCLRRIKM